MKRLRPVVVVNGLGLRPFARGSWADGQPGDELVTEVDFGWGVTDRVLHRTKVL